MAQNRKYRAQGSARAEQARDRNQSRTQGQDRGQDRGQDQDHRRGEAHRRSLGRREGRHGRVSAAEIIALTLSVLWIAGVGLFLLFTGAPGNSGTGGVEIDRIGFVMTLIAIFMPVAMIWVGAAAARSGRVMREESARLQAAIDAIRQSYVDQAFPGPAGMGPTVEQKLEEIARTARKTETALTTFTSIRQPVQMRSPLFDASPARPALAPEAAPDTGQQGSLALGTPAEALLSEPVSTADFLRALNFPENGEDKEGFRALRRALHDRMTAQLVTAAQEVLRLLAEEGIYMDDLSPDRARPEIWRRFARGERGRAVAGLGGVRDRSSLALAAGRMRQDPDFRGAVHHFLRRFDDMLVGFEPAASDAEIAELSQTRTARAFMLMGRVTGTFA